MQHKIVFTNLNFLQQNKIPQKKKDRKKNLFQYSHALRIACALEGSLDHCCVSRLGWASQVYVHSVVIDLGPRDIRCISPSLSSFLLSSSLIYFLSMSLVLQNQNVHGRKFTFSAFHFFVFILIFLSFFLWRRSDGRRQKKRYQKKWVKAVVRMVTRVWKESFLGVFFEHDRRSELMELNQTKRMPWLIIFRQGLAAVVCFFW